MPRWVIGDAQRSAWPRHRINKRKRRKYHRDIVETMRFVDYHGDRECCARAYFDFIIDVPCKLLTIGRKSRFIDASAAMRFIVFRRENRSTLSSHYIKCRSPSATIFYLHVASINRAY